MSLRVSVAALVRVIFKHPLDGESMLALERKGTVFEEAGQQRVHVRAQPFGGAITFRSLEPLRTLIGDFQFDSERSRSENDFRILIRPSDWNVVKQFCLQHLVDDDTVLESDPDRELAEEFSNALGVSLRSSQYEQQPLDILVEHQAVPTQNPRAPGFATARIYRIFEARITDTSLAQMICANSERCSDQDLHEQALADFHKGGRGHSNATLALSLKDLTEAYLAMSPESRAAPVTLYTHQLERNVPAILGVGLGKA